ncbi:MAG: hypothetical protein ACFFBP_00845 [Promethearchaeota archaeon]
MNEFLIDGLWILDIDSGSCLFEENYKKWSIKDTQLISSFLTAMRSFTKEAFSEDIQFIQFTHRKIIFEISGRILFIIAIQNSDLNKDILRYTIKEIINRFNKTFHPIISSNKILKDFKQFSSFSAELREIVDREPVNIKLISDVQIKRLYKKRNERRMRRLDEMNRCI